MGGGEERAQARFDPVENCGWEVKRETDRNPTHQMWKFSREDLGIFDTRDKGQERMSEGFSYLVKRN